MIKLTDLSNGLDIFSKKEKVQTRKNQVCLLKLCDGFPELVTAVDVDTEEFLDVHLSCNTLCTARN